MKRCYMKLQKSCIDPLMKFIQRTEIFAASVETELRVKLETELSEAQLVRNCTLCHYYT